MVRCDWASTRAGAGHRGHITSAVMTATGFPTPSLLSLNTLQKPALLLILSWHQNLQHKKKVNQLGMSLKLSQYEQNLLELAEITFADTSLF